MHKEILSKKQIELLPLVKLFNKEFYLVGGTALALQIGHRRSLDFDLFNFKKLGRKAIISKISTIDIPYLVTRSVAEQLNISISGVKFTFLEYPFEIDTPLQFQNIARMPKLIDLAAMKAYALGRISKWKDYVDLFFLIKDHFTIEKISKRASYIFGQLFSQKLFRAQLAYFKDIDYFEPIEYLISAPNNNDVKQYLIAKALDLGKE